MAFISYAQNREDVLLHRVFGGQETGFYVDVGAHHPVNGSTTKAFYDRGWSGINVEPSSLFAEFETARPRDVNLEMAVMDRAGEIAFIEVEGDLGMSHVVVEENGGGGARMVPCDTLEAIVSAHSRGRPVDFIKVDVEGAEAAIVHSTNWRLLRPRVLLLEATLPWSSRLANHDWEPALLEQGYVRAFFDGINCFYIPEEEAPVLLRHFQAPVNVLDRVVAYDCEVLRTALQDRQNELSRVTVERDDHRNEVARLTAEQDALRQRLQHLQNEAAVHAVERDTLTQELQDQQSEAARLTAERDALRAALEHQRSEAARLTAERDALRAALEHQQSEAARLTAERDAVRAALEHQQSEVVAELSGKIARTESVIDYVTQRKLVERMLFRPDGRPVKPLRRLLFHTSGKPRRLFRRVVLHKDGTPRKAFARWMQNQICLPRAATRQAARLTAERMDTLPFRPPPQDNVGSEMRRLAVEIENALLTLAMERGADAWPATAPAPYEAAPALVRVGYDVAEGASASLADRLNGL